MFPGPFQRVGGIITLFRAGGTLQAFVGDITKIGGIGGFNFAGKNGLPNAGGCSFGGVESVQKMLCTLDWTLPNSKLLGDDAPCSFSA